MLADPWTQRAGSVFGPGYPDQSDAARGVQAAVAADRGPDDVGIIVDGVPFSAPDHTTVSRRAVTLPVIQATSVPHGPLHVLIDSTGLQVYGAGQWLEAKHGAKSRRKWRKLHLAVDAASGMIVAQTLTDQDTDDPSQVAPLLDQIDDPLGQVTADGAYDGEPTYQTIAQHGEGIEVVIPPRSTSVPSGEPGPPT